MSIKPFFKLIRNNQLSAFAGSNALLKPFYRLTCIVAAKESGLLDLLSDAPKSFDEIAAIYCKDGKAREALEAWLQLAVRVGMLQLAGGAYALKGLARKLAQPQNDAVLALLQEVGGLHYNLITQTLEKLHNGELFELGDQDGEIIARSSRILEAFQTEAIDRFFPVTGTCSLLEIGCGSGIYIKHAASRNPTLAAVGMDLQPDVAEVARRNIAEWGLNERVTIETGDIRLLATGERFDIVTLYNNIYYFPVDSRVALLEHIRQFVKPGGFLLVITCCQGGSLGMEVLNLWGAATSTGGRLPSKEELAGQLDHAGFQGVQTVRLIPGESFFAFKALRGLNG